MEKVDNYNDFVDGLVSQIRALNDMAVREYTPLVDDICSRIVSQKLRDRRGLPECTSLFNLRFCICDGFLLNLWFSNFSGNIRTGYTRLS